jgi:hypothetical protein
MEKALFCKSTGTEEFLASKFGSVYVLALVDVLPSSMFFCAELIQYNVELENA